MKTRAQELGEAIGKDRAKTGASQEDLADAVGVTQQAFSGWEKGESIPRAARLIKLWEIFGPQSNTGKVIEHFLPKDVLVHQGHTANNLLIVDEPELNIHSHNLPYELKNPNRFRRPKGGKPMGEMSSDQKEPTPHMDTDDRQEDRVEQSQGGATYGIKSFETRGTSLAAGEVHEAISRAAKGVDLARQVLDDAAIQLARVMQQLQKA